MEHLRRRCGHTDLNIVLGAELQVALKARRRMLWPLALIAMGQQHGQTTEAGPFVLTTGDELVDNHLGTVGEIPKLGFPDNETLG